jgi:hypothetical protein
MSKGRTLNSNMKKNNIADCHKHGRRKDINSDLKIKQDCSRL